MQQHGSFLQTSGSQIINRRGEPVWLRGVSLGGWLNMENFIYGYPGTEHRLRQTMKDTLGEQRATAFFNQLLDYFVTEDDIRFIKELGATVIRLPFNYRHFERDDQPFEYREAGFARVDQLIAWARAHELYVILDLHAAQGWQNRGWHSDNPSGNATLWGNRCNEDRVIGLWVELARRYRDEPWVAGYNLLNEPDADDHAAMNAFYRRITSAIRDVDPDHILFVEGNIYSQRLNHLEAPFAENLVYSTHNYVDPGLEHVAYPGEVNGVHYDAQRLAQVYDERAAWTREHNVPHWLGEFGCLYNVPAHDASRDRVLDDLISVANARGDHWTIWTYKDIGTMGLVTVRPDSPWVQHIQPILDLKRAFRCDSWFERHHTEVDTSLEALTRTVHAATDGLPGRWHDLNAALTLDVCDGVLGEMLVPAFAALFSNIDDAEIDRLLQSFAFDQCVERHGLAEILRRHLREPQSSESPTTTQPVSMSVQ